MASRAASASVLGFLAEHIDNMIVSSADLANSDKTDGFLKKTRAFLRGGFLGRVPPDGCRRTHHGLRHQRYRAPRRCVRGLRHFLRLQRLYEAPPSAWRHCRNFREVHLFPMIRSASERMVPLTNPSSRRHRYVLWSRCAISAAVPPCFRDPSSRLCGNSGGLPSGHGEQRHSDCAHLLASESRGSSRREPPRGRQGRRHTAVMWSFRLKIPT